MRCGEIGQPSGIDLKVQRKCLAARHSKRVLAWCKSAGRALLSRSCRHMDWNRVNVPVVLHSRADSEGSEDHRNEDYLVLGQSHG